MALSSAWDVLRYFESTELVKRQYRAVHGGSANTGKSLEIAAHVSQARQYFESADGAADLIRPLLVYYAAQALTRSLILFTNVKSRESSLPHSHGLETVGWSADLASGPPAISNLKVRALSRGTFPAFVAATNGEDFLSDNGLFSRKQSRVPGTPQITPGVEFSMREVLARMPPLINAYEVSFGETAKVFPVHVSRDLDDSIDMRVPQEGESIRTVDDVLNALQLPPETPLELKEPSKRRFELDYRPYYAIDWSQDDWPPQVKDWHDQSYAIVPVLGHRLSFYSWLYIGCYMAGMLVRYHPTTWLQLIGRGSGDELSPLLAAFNLAAEERLPEFALKFFL